MIHPAELFGDILDHPHDDEPRLRYANWLEERGDPLGEFIRVQCRLAKLAAISHSALPGADREAMPAQESSKKHAQVFDLENRERSLLAEHERIWMGDLAEMTQWCVFRRGFVAEIALTSSQFLIHAPAIFERAPIQILHLARVRDRLESLAASAFLQKPAYVDLSGNLIRDHGVRTLLESPHLRHVQGLNLSSSGIGDAGVAALAASDHLEELRELYLCDNRISDAGVKALASSPVVNQLDTLHLRFNAIGSDGANLLQRKLGRKVHV